MNTIIALQTKAVTAAKNQAWNEAASLNREILELEPENIGALMRLSMAQIQLQKLKEAKANLKKILKIDPQHQLALRHLENMEKNHLLTPNFNDQHFIEEPSKSKIVHLHRLSDKKTLSQLTVGQVLILKPKKHFISVETTAKVYIGSLPDDVSKRLILLIADGNQYEARVHSLSNKHCDIYLRESFQSEANRGKLSFPISKSGNEANLDIADEFLVENNLPIELGESEYDDGDAEGGNSEEMI